MDYTELTKRQVSLQTEARKCLADVGLIKILQKYGEVKMVGSLANGLMTYKDIDLAVVGVWDLEKVAKLTAELITQKVNYSVMLNNFVDFPTDRLPTAYYVGLKKFCQDWKLDLWLYTEAQYQEQGYDAQIKELLGLSQEKRELILYTKELLNDEALREVLKTNDRAQPIYQAVLSGTISTTKDAQDYVSSLKKRY